jgi:carboxyl-terminal processing protease
LVQRQFTLPDNSAIRLTISEYYTPSGRLIQREYKDKKNSEEYYPEILDSLKEGDNTDHQVEKDSTKPLFKTEGGRTVYGGGGITPDFIYKAELLSDYSRELLRNNIFYQFTLNYIEKNGQELTTLYGNDLKKFNDEFNLDDAELNNFIRFAESKEVVTIKEDYIADKDYIAARLKAQIARNYWKNEGWYTVILKVDTQLHNALNLFDKAKELAELK